MSCANCGVDNPEAARFCIQCGNPMPDVETTAKFEREEITPYELPPLEAKPNLWFAARTDMGRVRENNEDKFDFFEPEEPDEIAARGTLFIVCDGMGGHEAGQIASELACKLFIQSYFGPIGSPPAEAARTAALAANRYIYDVSRTVRSREGMGTTLTAAAFCQNRVIIAQVGDSRCYRWRNNELEMVTSDHTWVNEQVRMGLMTESEALQSPYAHVLTRAIGSQEVVEVDVFDEPLEEGDTYLLCSDGLTNHVTDAQIADVLSRRAPGPACLELVQAALDGGGSDNCTVFVIKATCFSRPE